MVKYDFDIEYFMGASDSETPDGNAMILEERVDDALELLEDDKSCLKIALANGEVVSCKSKEEVIQVLEKNKEELIQLLEKQKEQK